MSTRLDYATLSLMDALDLATLIELEAYRRYKMFAAQLGQGGTNNPASVFASMAENEAKHGQQLAERRKALFGVTPARVTLDDLFDVEAPDMGAPRSTMSTLQAFQVALSSEQKAYDFYDQALEHISDAEIRALFTELRDEETEHVRMVQEAIAKLPPSASVELELDLDDSPSL
ncbi:MAG: ferritin family protein [Myxococcales bacterium]|nr:ferritin family protein [Myxococcales bacterium]